MKEWHIWKARTVPTNVIINLEMTHLIQQKNSFMLPSYEIYSVWTYLRNLINNRYEICHNMERNMIRFYAISFKMH